MHYYKRNLGDYAKKAGRLTMLQHGAYTLLIDAYYDRERPPTRDDAIAWAWAESAEEIAAVEFCLRKFFDFDGEVYRQSRIDEEIEAYHGNALTNKRIALEREAKKRARKVNESSTKRAPSVNEACTNEHEPAPNHKPLTINQEPLKPFPEIASDSGDSGQGQLVEVLDEIEATKTPKADRKKPLTESQKAAQKVAADTWAGYSIAYLQRYNTEPVRNAKVNAQIVQLVKRLGTDAPHVAAFYLSSNDAWHVKACHSIDSLLKNAEAMRTQWATGRVVTGERARAIEKHGHATIAAIHNYNPDEVF